MAFYSRRGNWGWNPYKKYRYGSKRTKGNLKAAKQTRDAMNVTVKCNTTFMAAYNKIDNYGTAVVPVYEVLKKSPQFSSFSALYDQVKINGIRCKLSIVDADTSLSDLSNLKTINVITGWDRTGISNEQLKFFSDLGNPGAEPPAPPTLINPDKYDEAVVKCFTYSIGRGIVNATGVAKTTVNATTRWTTSPYLYPSTTEEKSCYLSTSSFKDFVAAQSLTNGYSKLSGEFDGLTVHQLTNASNPCIPFESPICKWKPCLMVGVFRSTISEDSNHIKYIEQFDDCPQILFNAEFSVDVTFRNIKAATRELDTNPPSPEPTPMPVIEDNKTITITNYLDNQIVEPDDGYDALKQVTINVDIQPPAEHNIEENKRVILNELDNSYRIIPSTGYDYMQEVNIVPQFRVTNIDLGYTIGQPDFDPPLVVRDQHFFTDSTYKAKHPNSAQTVAQHHVRVGLRICRYEGGIQMTEVFIIFAAQGPVKYFCDYNYYYLDISTPKESWATWRTHPWKFEGDDYRIVQLFSPFYQKVRFGPVINVNTTLFKFFFETSKFYFPLWETEDIGITDVENQSLDLDITIEDEENTQNNPTNIQSQLSNMEIEEEN